MHRRSCLESRCVITFAWKKYRTCCASWSNRSVGDESWLASGSRRFLYCSLNHGYRGFRTPCGIRCLCCEAPNPLLRWLLTHRCLAVSLACLLLRLHVKWVRKNGTDPSDVIVLFGLHVWKSFKPLTR